MQCGPNCACVCGACTLDDCGCACHDTGLDDASTATIRSVLASYGVTATARTTMYIHVKNHAKQSAIVSAIKKVGVKKRVGKSVRAAVGSIDAEKVKAAMKKAKGKTHVKNAVKRPKKACKDE